MQAIAWRVQTEDKEKFSYRLQIDGIRGIRAQNRILKIVEQWNPSGEGYCPRNNEAILFFTRTFETVQSWIKWAKQYPYELIEVKKDGTPKPIKLGAAARKRKKGTKRS